MYGILLKKRLVLIFVLILISFNINIIAETLDSTNYRIKDVTLGGTGESNSTNYSLIGSFNPIEDSRLTSSNYALKTGFPNGIIANVPTITCFETDSTSINTTCVELPSSNGAQGECGYPGCYDRAKVELNTQNNPIDTLYVVKILDVTNSITYFLKTDHTLGTSFNISNFMDKCDLQGKDSANTNCDDSGDTRWNVELQKYNIFGLRPNTQYSASISALNGDFTGTDFGPNLTSITTNITIAFDLDIGPISSPTIETSSPYSINLGTLAPSNISTANDLIWIDLNTNTATGISMFVKDQYNGLNSSGGTLNSQTEDLDIDIGGDGGYGLKTYNYTPSESALGPLLKASLYDTINANQVGAVSTSINKIFYTEDIGGNRGPIKDGRASIYVKAKTTNSNSAGTYTDILTFILITNL
jgi:hypothetical protein